MIIYYTLRYYEKKGKVRNKERKQCTGGKEYNTILHVHGTGLDSLLVGFFRKAIKFYRSVLVLGLTTSCTDDLSGIHSQLRDGGMAVVAESLAIPCCCVQYCIAFPHGVLQINSSSNTPQRAVLRYSGCLRCTCSGGRWKLG